MVCSYFIKHSDCLLVLQKKSSDIFMKQNKEEHETHRVKGNVRMKESIRAFVNGGQKIEYLFPY